MSDGKPPPCMRCGYPAAGPWHSPPDACIEFLLASLAARDVELGRTKGLVRGLQHLIKLDRERRAQVLS